MHIISQQVVVHMGAQSGWLWQIGFLCYSVQQGCLTGMRASCAVYGEGVKVEGPAQVVLEEEEGGISRKVPLTVQGLTPSGYLKAVDQGGTLFELHPDGNRCGSSTCC